MEADSYYQKLSDIFRDKPELVVRFPDWMLSTDRLETIGRMENPAIVEIAGRDSVAAAVQSVAESAFTDLIPVYAYTGTEYGNWTNVTQALERLAARLPETRVHRLLVMGSPVFWRALNARFVDEWISRFQYYSPCPGCHLYLHAVRIPLAKLMGGIPIISGERESHSGVVKINQTAQAIDIYSDLARRFDVRLILPLRHVTRGEEIETILKMPWARDEEQLKCVFSGNYRRMNGSVGPSVADVKNYFTKFAIPVIDAAISAYMSGVSPNVEGIARQALQGIPEPARET
jgi:hypothetical protein